MGKKQILIVEDEPKIVKLLCEVLRASGFDVFSTGKGSTAIELAAMEQPDLILLDVVLSGDVDGYKVAKRVREFSDVPIIMLTAKARESDMLRGFDAGVDDYITKPFSSKELLARTRAVFKRAAKDTIEPTESVIECGDLVIDIARRRVRSRGIEVKLTRTEFNLLMRLAKNRDQVVLHEQLLTDIWGPEYRDDIDYLRAFIRYLRKKIEKDPTAPKMIITSQGVGYMLTSCEE
jgi:two-component system KDP operon response regulator KdpE